MTSKTRNRIRAFKAVFYPIAGLFQFWLAYEMENPLYIFYVVLGVALIGLGITNLVFLVEGGNDGAKPSG